MSKAIQKLARDNRCGPGPGRVTEAERVAKKMNSGQRRRQTLCLPNQGNDYAAKEEKYFVNLLF